MDALKDLSMDLNLVRSEAHEAYNILITKVGHPRRVWQQAGQVLNISERATMMHYLMLSPGSKV